MVTAKIIGERELLRRLRKLDPGTNTRILRVALVGQMDWLLERAAKTYFERGPRATASGFGRSSRRSSGQSYYFSAKSHPPNPPPGPLVTRSGTKGLGPSLLHPSSVDKSELPKRIKGGSRLPYAAIHEKGGGNIPARPYLRPALNDLKSSGAGERILRVAWERFGLRP